MNPETETETAPGTVAETATETETDTATETLTATALRTETQPSCLFLVQLPMYILFLLVHAYS